MAITAGKGLSARRPRPTSPALVAQESPNVSDNTAAPAKSKKLIIILAVLALVLVAGGAAAWMMLSHRHAAEDEEGGGRAVAQAGTPKTPPTFLPMENMVVNLADPAATALPRWASRWSWPTARRRTR